MKNKKKLNNKQKNKMNEPYTNGNGNGNGNGEKLSDKYILGYGEPIIPSVLKDMVKISPESKKTVISARKQLRNIYDLKDKRKIVITGPCSVHDVESAIDYAKRLSELNLEKEINENLLLIMRVYFEKPRTTTGWKGLINDPYMDGSYNMKEGYLAARRLLSSITQMSVACATEVLEVFTPQYIGEFFSWAAIGARTVESQCHRIMASGLSSAVGFKNNTEGNIQVAVDAQKVAFEKGVFLGINNDGISCPVPTEGNPYNCVILRGSKKGANYSLENIDLTLEMQKRAGVREGIIIDCSHDQIRNEKGKKDVLKQIEVAKKSLEYMIQKPQVLGIMLESNLIEGNQPEPKKREDIPNLIKGQSITDPCISWNDTKNLLRYLAHELAINRRVA
jgi:3-deoxy-7-phosphoheptulonate synthase